MHKFFGWLGEVFCGLAAYTLSRWIWDYHVKPEDRSRDSIFSHLPAELGTFILLYVLLKLAMKAIGLARKNRKAAKQLGAKA